MTKIQLLILLCSFLLHIAAAFPSDRRGREKSASWDDVNVVAHGLLQLGQGLKEHVDKTKAQMREVNTKLKEFNSTLAELERRQQEQDRALKEKSREVEEREGQTAALEGMKVKVEEVKRQTEDMESRMDRLEEVLTEPALDSNDSDHTGVPFIQRLVAAQNRRIDQLVEKIKQQQDKLEKQTVHLQALQSKVGQKRVKSHRRRDEETVLEMIQPNSGLARDCHDLFVQGQKTSGVYTIQPENSEPFNVLCQMTSEGGWTVIQKRQDGSQNFNQLWQNYKDGFGSLNGEFWLGLDHIHSLSRQGSYVLQVALSDEAGQQQEAQYHFHLDGEEKEFSLHLEPDSSSSSSSSSSGGHEPISVPFSTSDRDNDLAADVNCAELLSGGWWFSSCGDSNLNGKYPRRPSVVRRQQRRVMFWETTKGQSSSSSLKTTMLKIKPAAKQ